MSSLPRGHQELLVERVAVEQNVAISSLVPGSWPMNWLKGKPSKVNPRAQ